MLPLGGSAEITTLAATVIQPPKLLTSTHNTSALIQFLDDYKLYKDRTKAAPALRTDLLALLGSQAKREVETLQRNHGWSIEEALQSLLWKGSSYSDLLRDLRRCAMSDQHTSVALSNMTTSFIRIIEAAKIKGITLPNSQLVKLYRENIRPEQMRDALLQFHDIHSLDALITEA